MSLAVDKPEKSGLFFWFCHRICTKSVIFCGRAFLKKILRKNYFYIFRYINNRTDKTSRCNSGEIAQSASNIIIYRRKKR